ncbi:MAG: hypothetical protein SF162_01440 [bacterium]|nr:hypothetical protein [bacterium]
MSNAPAQPPSNRPRSLGLRLLITLALLTLIGLILIFNLTQPVAAPGADETAATSEVTAPAESRTSTLSGQILFTSNRDGNWELYSVPLPNGDPINLSNHPAADGFAGYSTDRAQISFVSGRDGELAGFLMNADGTNQVGAQADIPTLLNILTNGRGDWDRRTAADGSATVISLRDLNLELYYQPLGNAEQINLSRSPAIDWYAHLSPDGRRVAFVSDRVDGQHDLYVIDVTGENLTRLTDDPANDWSPLWLDDGDRILFASERTPFTGVQLALYVIDLGGMTSGAVPAAVLVDDMDTPVTTHGIVQNGLSLAMSNQAGNWDIVVRDAAGMLTNVTNHPDDDVFPVWMPQ